MKSRDKLGMVVEREGGRFSIDPSLMETLEIYSISGIEYVLDKIPGISSEGAALGMDLFYHEPKSSKVPRMFIENKAIYRAVSRSSYTSEDIVEPVTNLNLAVLIIDDATKQWKERVGG